MMSTATRNDRGGRRRGIDRVPLFPQSSVGPQDVERVRLRSTTGCFDIGNENRLPCRKGVWQTRVSVTGFASSRARYVSGNSILGRTRMGPKRVLAIINLPSGGRPHPSLSLPQLPHTTALDASKSCRNGKRLPAIMEYCDQRYRRSRSYSDLG